MNWYFLDHMTPGILFAFSYVGAAILFGCIMLWDVVYSAVKRRRRPGRGRKILR
jgi:hypothetical protein